MSLSLESHPSDKKRGFTLWELYNFVKDAENAGIDLSSQVKVDVGFSRQIKLIEVGS